MDVEVSKSEYGNALNSLQQNESNFRIMFESSLDGLLIATLGGQVCEVNAAVCNILGYTREELLKLNRTDLIVIANPELQLGFKTRDENGGYSDIAKFKRKDGVIIETEISTSIFGGIDNETYTYVSIRDITEKINSQRKINQSEANLHALINNTNDSIFSIDRNLKIMSLNKAFIQQCYLTMGVRFKEGDDLINEAAGKERISAWRNYISRAFNGDYFKIEEEYEYNGDTYYNEVAFSPILNNGEVTGLVCFISDITQSKLSVVRMINSEKRFRTLIENSTDGIMLSDGNRKILYMSPSVKNILGYEPDELVGHLISELMNPAEFAQNMALIQYILQESGRSITAQLRIKHKNDEFRWLEITSANQLNDPSVNAIVSNFRDVTERINAETAIRESEERYRLIAENPQMGIAWTSLDGHVMYANEALCNILGYSNDELIKMHYWDFTYPEDLEKEKVLFHQMILGDINNYKLEKRYITKGKEIIWVDINLSSFKDNKGRIKYFIGVVQDISARKSAEAEISNLNYSLEKKVEQRTAQLNEANKDLESFSYSVAHDLRAPLRVLNGYAKILLSDYRDKLGKDGKELLDVIMSRSVLMGQLITNMLEFAKINRIDIAVEKTDLNAIVKEVIDTIKGADGQIGAEIIVHDLGNCNCDGVLIKQVWFNLISNAIKYSKKNSNPVVEIGAKEEEDGHCVFYVKDNGVGFDMENSDKLFMVFQRLHSKSEFEGTGVGLAIAHRIVTKHGGKIWAEAQLNKGATFFFTLPNEN